MLAGLLPTAALGQGVVEACTQRLGVQLLSGTRLEPDHEVLTGSIHVCRGEPVVLD